MSTVCFPRWYINQPRQPVEGGRLPAMEEQEEETGGRGGEEREREGEREGGEREGGETVRGAP